MTIPTRWPWLLALGAIVYLVVLVVTLPARFVLQWLPDGVSAVGVEGTAWRGRVATIAVERTRVDDLRWRLRPAALLRARAAASVEARVAGGFVDGDVAITATGTVHARDLRGAFPLAELASVAGFQGIAGQLSIDLQALRLDDGWPGVVEGTARIGNLRIADLDDEPVGDYELQFDTRGDDIVGRLRDRGGPLEVSGALTLGADRAWELDGTVRTRADARPRLGEVLSMLGNPDAEGRREFSLAGRL